MPKLKHKNHQDKQSLQDGTRRRGTIHVQLRVCRHEMLREWHHKLLTGSACGLQGCRHIHPPDDWIVVTGTPDVLAAGVMFDCISRGWSVPDRLAVVGFGDYEIAKELPPGITTVRTPGDKIGQQAARMIISQYTDNKAEDKIIDVGYAIVSRGSA